MQVIVVTGFELGWDNVIGVFGMDEKEAVFERFENEDRYYVQVKTIAKVEEYD